MQLLVFNTTLKVVNFTTVDGLTSTWKNVPTVKVQDGYYEIMQKVDTDDDLSTSVSRSMPVFRCPISNTNMRIDK